MADFLDKMKEGLGKGISTIGTKSKEFADSSRVKSQITDLERQKKENLIELGTAICVMLDEDKINPDPLKVKRSTIAEIDRQIKAKQNELVEIHAQAQQALGGEKPGTRCTCGAAIPEGAKFCLACGQKVGATGTSA